MSVNSHFRSNMSISMDTKVNGFNFDHKYDNVRGELG